MYDAGGVLRWWAGGWWRRRPEFFGGRCIWWLPARTNLLGRRFGWSIGPLDSSRCRVLVRITPALPTGPPRTLRRWRRGHLRDSASSDCRGTSIGVPMGRPVVASNVPKDSRNTPGRSHDRPDRADRHYRGDGVVRGGVGVLSAPRRAGTCRSGRRPELAKQSTADAAPIDTRSPAATSPIPDRSTRPGFPEDLTGTVFMHWTPETSSCFGETAGTRADLRVVPA